VVLAACGRIGFEPSGDAGIDALPAQRSIELPSGGQMKQVVFAPNGNWYALSETAGAFRSTDGETWTRCGAHVGGGIAVTSDNTVWIAGNDVGRSTDDCATWQNTGNPRRSLSVFADGATIFALNDNGLRRWNGTSWQVVTTPLDGAPFMKMAKGPQRYFIATLVGLLVSPDGTTWTSKTTGFSDNNLVDVVGGTTRTYAISIGDPGGISCSDATGATWSVCYGAGGFSLFADAANDQRVLAGVYDDLALTTNGFGSATVGLRAAASMDAALVSGITSTPAGNLVFASDRGIFVGIAPGAIATLPQHTGINAWDIDRITVHGNDMYLATRGGPLRSIDGAPFESSTQGVEINTNVFDTAVAPDGTVFIAGRGLFRSDDRGATMTEALAAGAPDVYRFHSVGFDGTRAIAGSQTRVFTSDPPYTTWTPHTVAGNRDVIAIHATPGKLFIGTTQGAYVSVDGASTFQVVGGIGTVRVHDFADLPDGSLIAASVDGVWKSDATRTTWARAGLAGMYVDGVETAGTKLFAATDRNVQYSTDGGLSWATVAGAELSASDVVIDGATLIVGTDSRGLIRVPLP
jgi:hypothetical protein